MADGRRVVSPSPRLRAALQVIGSTVGDNQLDGRDVLTPYFEAHRPGTLIGHIVGNYELKAVLGEGGMGTVYLAEHPFMGRRAAVKVLRRALADDKVQVSRFMNEARAANAIRHPNIIDIIDLGVLPEGLPYLMMELLEGDSLGTRLRAEARLPVQQALDITRQTAAALGAAHDKGIVHRDLKPDNLFLVRDPQSPGNERVKVLDFGIAKLMGNELAGSLATKSGVLLGTPLYMSPEQCRGIANEVDHRTDIYSLAVILYQMLAGKAPFVAAGTGDVLMMHVGLEPRPVRQENPDVPEHVEAAVQRGLAKTREGRFQSMRELAAALSPAGAPANTLQIQGEPDLEPLRPTSPLPSPVVAGESMVRTRHTRSFRRPVLTAALLAVAAGAVFVFVGRQLGRLSGSSTDEPTPRPAAATRPVDVQRAPVVPPSPFRPEPAPPPETAPAPAPVAAPAPAPPPAPAETAEPEAAASGKKRVTRLRGRPGAAARQSEPGATPPRKTKLW